MYGLNLSEDSRILSACIILPDGNYEGMVIVESLPEGDVFHYLYENGEYIYAPLPPAEPGEETADLETRVGELEEALNMILAGVTE